MTTSRRYTLIVPRVDRTGPCNVAVDLARAAAAAGWSVQLLYLSGTPSRDVGDAAIPVRRVRIADLFSLRGVVHTHCLRPDLLGALLRLNRRCLVLTTLHNYFLFDLAFDHSRWKVRLAWWIWSRAIARLHHRVCISQAMRRYYRRLLPGSTFDLAYNFRTASVGAPPPLSATLKDWVSRQRSRGRIRITYVGSLSPRKNLLPLVRAVAAAPELALVLCGEGPLRPALEAAIAEHDAADRVVLAGQVARPDGVLAQVDMLVLPSLAEGLPLVVIEAASMGVPSLMSNICVHRELAALGLGTTFERHGFGRFREAAHRLAAQSSPAARERLVALWRQRFSPEPGFAAYERLFGAPTPRGSSDTPSTTVRPMSGRADRQWGRDV